MEEINLAENEKALHEMRQKRKKSKKIKKIIIPIAIVAVILVLIIVVAVVGIIMGSKVPTVQVTSLKRGDIESTISVTGTVNSDRKITYYSPASAKVTKVATAGEMVKKGDILVEFDENDIAYQVAVATLQGNINENSYNQSLAQYNKSRSEYNAAKQKVTEYTELVNAQQAVVDKIKNEQTDASYSNLEAQVNKNKELNKVSGEMETIASTTLAPIMEQIQALSKLDENDPLIAPLEEQYKKLCEETGYNDLAKKQAQLRNDLTELDAASRSIGATSKEQQNYLDQQRVLAEYQTELETAKALVKQYEASSTAYDKSGIELNKELADLQANHQMEELDKVLGGVVAEFDGVVTQTGISEGDTAIAGSGVVSIASVEDVYVLITVTKNDLKKIREGQKATIKIFDNEYEGTVSSVSRVASMSDKGTSQVTAMVRIDNPDDKIYLGIDAKTVITAANATDCLMLPVEAVFSDDEGDFVYAVEDGMVVKKYITVGISSSRYIEVSEGLNEDAVVMTSIDSNITEGMMVNAVNPNDIMSAIGGAVVEESSSEVNE